MDHRRIGDMLVDEGAVSARDVEAALRFQDEVGGLFGQALMRLGAVSEDVLLAALSRQLGLTILTAPLMPAEGSAYLEACSRLNLSPRWLLAHECVLWFDTQDGVAAGDADALNVFARDPMSAPLQEALTRVWAGAVQYYLGPNRLLDSALALARSEGASEDWTGDDAARLRELAEEAPCLKTRCASAHLTSMSNRSNIISRSASASMACCARCRPCRAGGLTPWRAGSS